MNSPLQNQTTNQYVPVEAPQSRAPQTANVASNATANVAAANASEPNLDFISTDNRENEYQQALRHSKKVKFWKIAFPIMGVMMILALGGALALNSMKVPEVAVESITLDDGNLVMENPELNGFDKNKRPFNLTAAKAIQNVENPTQVELQDIKAELPMDETIRATVSAGNGFYDADAKTLILKQSVNLVTSNGMVVNLQDADVDIGNSTMKTDNPISATSPQADISSNTMRIEEGGNKMTFEGRVRMTLRPGELRKTSDANETN